MPSPPVIRLHPDDGVVIARATLLPGAPVAEGVVATMRIPAGHKIAVRPHAVGEPVRRYGQIIGFATAPIAPGEQVHVHNLGMGDFSKDYAYGVDATPTQFFDPPATFQGIRRPDGARRDAQLHRHPDERELFGRTSRAWSPTRSSAIRGAARIRSRIIRMSTAWSR